MCAAVEATEKDPPTDPADNYAGKMEDDMLTVWFEAAQLFTDDGQQRGFAPSAAARAMPGLREQRKARLDCDVVFRATDGVEVWAHRFVMWHKFSGCCALFDVAKESRTPDQKKNDLAGPPVRAVIKDLEGDMVEELVEYAYYTPLHERIGLQNVVKVLELAETLNISRIRAHCLMTLKHNLEPENCISVYHLACSRGYANLASSAYQYLVRNFDKLWKDSAQFEALTPEEMRTILEDDRLHAPSEVEDTFKAILKWISADVAARKMYLAKFLPLVRFVRCGLLELEYVRTHPEVDGDVDIQNIMHVINQTLTEPSMAAGEVAGIDLSPKLWLTPRLPKDILFLFGGWAENAPTNEMLTYNNRSHKWRNFGNQSTVARAYHDAAVIDSRIYFVGGFSGNWVCNTVACFDVLQATWSVKAKMAYHRCFVSVAVLQGYIYAMGGVDGNDSPYTKTVERYDVKADKWSMVAHMNDLHGFAGAGTARGRIYIAGGIGHGGLLDTVECYDPSTDAWTRVGTMSSPRAGLKVVVYRHTLYIIGGYNKTGRLTTMEQFDVMRARFSDLPSMPRLNSNFAAALLEGSIYIIGGYDGEAYRRSVERYDIAEGKWHSAPPIHARRSVSVACVVHDIADPARWI